MLKFFLVILSASWCVGQYVASEEQKNDERNKPCLEISLECPKVDGEYPVYSALPNCSQFCQCSNGKPYLHDCPPVLHFNPVLNVCDYPEDAGCISNDDGENWATTEAGDDGAGTNPCIELGIDCPEICGERPIYLNLSDCNQYCECYNGKLLFRECPAGLHFNVNLEVCDFPDRAGCEDNNENETTDGEEGGTTRIPDSTSEEESNPCVDSGIECPAIDGEHPVYAPLSNCSQFCQCSNGIPYLHDCPSDLHFSPVLNVCDYPDRAGCKENGGGSGENNDSGENGDNGGDNNDGEESNSTNGESEGTTKVPDTGPEEESNACIEAGIKCPANDGEYPVYAPLSNCSQFCQCSNGIPYLHDCPSDLHFNPVLNVCDYPDRAGCKENGGGSGENNDSGENGDNGGDNNDGEESNSTNGESEGTTKVPDTGPEEESNACIEAGIKCPANDGEYPVYAPLSNCSQFCQCSNGIPYLHDCPSDLHFNPVLNVCDYPDRAGCKENGGGSGENNDSGENGDNGGDNNDGEESNSTNGESEGTTKIPDTGSEEESNACIEAGIKCPANDGEYPVYAPLSNCSQFCQCSNGIPYLHDCPSDLHFNPVLNVCDYPDRAGCKENGGGSGENNDSGENGDNEGDNNDGEESNSTNGESEGTTKIPDTGPEEESNACIEAGIKCPANDGEYPVYAPLSNCSQFCQCSNGIPYLHDCPSDLHFNPVLNVCDYPDRAGCKENGGGSGENGEGSGENNDSGENGDNGGDNNDGEESNSTNGESEGTTKVPDTGPEEESNACIEAGIKCPANDGEYPVYAPLSNCSQFCQCSNGIPYLHDCPSDLHFNPVLNVCDYPDRAGCKENGGGSGENGEGSGENNDSGENGDNGGDNNDGEESNSTNGESEGTTKIPDTGSEEESNACIEAGMKCPANDGEYPVYAPLSNCSQFCQCSNGIPYLHDCPSDLHFNPVLNVCDYPDRAGCKENGGGSGENNDSGENGDNGGDNNDGEESNSTNGESEGTTKIPDTGPEEESNACIEAGIKCPANDGEYPVYAPLSNCSQFCQCSNGIPYLHDCPSDLHFNPVLNVCDYPDRAGCKENGGGSGENNDSGENGDNGGDNNDGEESNSTNGESEGTSKIPDTGPEEESNACIEAGIKCPANDGEYPVYAPLSNCSQFCQCSNGIPYLHDCPSDLHFNPVLNVCDYPDRAGCKENGGGSGENNDSGENGDNGGDNNDGEESNSTNGESEDTTKIPDTGPEEESNACIEAGIKCPANDGEYPVYAPLSNCSQFCQCSNGIPYLHDCPSDLHFNPVLNVCDYPDRAGCKENGGGSGENNDSGENGDNGGDNNDGEESNSTNGESEDTTKIPDTGPEEESNACIEAGIKCPANDGEYPVYAPLSNCSQFCQCSNGIPYLHDCPSDLHFNPVLNVCDYPDRAGCKENGGGSGENNDSGENGDNGGDNNDGEESNSTNGESEGTTKIPDTGPEEESNACIEAGIKCPANDGEYPVYAPLSNCSQFCQCSNGIPYLHDCPSDLHFNPVLNVCDYPDRAGCKENGGGSGENNDSGENGDNGGDNNDGEESNSTNGESEGTTKIPDTGPEEESNACIEAGIKCPANDGEYPVYAPLSNCSQFCQCSNGIPYLHDCPSDLHFNPVLNVCDYPDRAGCKENGGGSGENNDSGENGDNGGDNNEGEESNSTNGESEGTTKIPDTGPEEESNACIEAGIKCPANDGEYPIYAPLSNCSQFCQCSNGIPYLHDCPSDLHFNPVLNVCDYPDRAGCKENGGGSGENGEGSGENNDSGENGDNGGDNNDGEESNSTNGESEGTTKIPDTGSEEESNACIESGIKCPVVDGEYPVYAPLPNCSQFCQCSNGKPYLHNCSADLHFNPVLNVCDYPDRAGCKGHGSPGSSDEADDCSGDKDDNGGDIDNNTSSESGIGEEGPCSKSGIECPKVDGMYPVYAPLPNCSQFCQCSNGKAYLFDCPGDLHFNPTLNVCDYDYRAGCVGAGDDNGSDEATNICLQSKIECPEVDGDHAVYAPLPDCSRFCQCSNGKPYLHSCPDGLHFNPTLETCDYAGYAGCASHNNTNFAL